MGEIADMMIDGTLDYQTGEYLGEGMGFPRTRNSRRHRQPDSVFGVRNYLSRFNIHKSEMYDHCFGFYLEVSGKENKGCKSWASVATFVQEHWSEFVKYSDGNLERKHSRN